MTGSEAVKRLESDLRTFSPAGIERVAWGWRQHEVDPARLHEAEKSALHHIETADRGEDWDALRLTLRDLMEGSKSLLSWKEEHGREGHTAERAVYAAALALMTGDQLPHTQYVALVRPLSEALPWLLPETPPRPSPALRPIYPARTSGRSVHISRPAWRWMFFADLFLRGGAGRAVISVSGGAARRDDQGR